MSYLPFLFAVILVFGWLAGASHRVGPRAMPDAAESFNARFSPQTTGAEPAGVPAIEALIPLSVDAMRDNVAQSVGFVLSEHGTGSGVVISDDVLVTNAHVVWPDPSVSVVFQNGVVHQGRVLALDPFVDLALVDISRMSRKPPPITLGSVHDIAVGDDLYVLGYPAPAEFTPLPTVDVGELQSLSDWEFTGVEWFTIEAPAIGGQSGGAVVDRYGRLVGMSTFGSTADLTSIAVDDVVAAVDRLSGSSLVRGLEPRALPHNGGSRRSELQLGGPWDQQLLFGWFLPDADVAVNWEDGSGQLRVTAIDGSSIATGDGSVDFAPDFAFPVVVRAESARTTGGTLDSSLPLIAYQDPDHGRLLSANGTRNGIYEVGGDRDFFYVDLEAGQQLAITIESAARTHLTVYSLDGEEIADDFDMAGFFVGDAETVVTAPSSGRFVVTVQSTLSTIAGYTVVTKEL